MAIRAVVFDIGGVLEITPDLGVYRRWEARLGLPAGEMGERMQDVWLGGGLGTITLDDVHRAITGRLGLDKRQVAAFMADMWREYLGTANTELIEYARGLRPRYRTGILSNSFVGAREREQAAYGFEDLVDEIVYSHEAGMSKPDRRIYALVCSHLNVRHDETVSSMTPMCAWPVHARRASMPSVTGTTPRPLRRSKSCSPPRDRTCGAPATTGSSPRDRRAGRSGWLGQRGA